MCSSDLVGADEVINVAEQNEGLKAHEADKGFFDVLFEASGNERNAQRGYDVIFNVGHDATGFSNVGLTQAAVNSAPSGAFFRILASSSTPAIWHSSTVLNAPTAE